MNQLNLIYIHIYVEMLQGNFLIIYLKQTEMPIFRNREHKGKIVPVWELILLGREDIRKG
jgi:hypothetical protein